MPIWARFIGNLLPLTYFNRLVRGILLKGNDWANLWPSVWPVVLFMVVVIAIALRLPAHARLGDVARAVFGGRGGTFEAAVDCSSNFTELREGTASEAPLWLR